MHEYQLLFAWLRRRYRPISVAKINEEMRQNHALADMAPNFISALKTYIVLFSDHAEALDLTECINEFSLRTEVCCDKLGTSL